MTPTQAQLNKELLEQLAGDIASIKEFMIRMEPTIQKVNKHEVALYGDGTPDSKGIIAITLEWVEKAKALDWLRFISKPAAALIVLMLVYLFVTHLQVVEAFFKP